MTRRTCNIVHLEDMLRAVEIPDCAATNLLANGKFHDSPNNPSRRFSFAAGDFVKLYGSPEHAGQWDAGMLTNEMVLKSIWLVLVFDWPLMTSCDVFLHRYGSSGARVSYAQLDSCWCQS